MKSLTILAFATVLLLAGPGAPVAAEVIPVQKSAVDNAGPSPFAAVGPIFAGIVGIAAGAAVATTAVGIIAPTAAQYPFAIAGSAVGAWTGWSVYKSMAEPMVRTPGPKTAEAPSLFQLAVDIRQ